MYYASDESGAELSARVLSVNGEWGAFLDGTNDAKILRCPGLRTCPR